MCYTKLLLSDSLCGSYSIISRDVCAPFSLDSAVLVGDTIDLLYPAYTPTRISGTCSVLVRELPGQKIVGSGSHFINLRI